MQTAETESGTVFDVITALQHVGPSGQDLFECVVRCGVPGEIAADVRMAMAELATNAFEHGATGAVSIALTVSDDSIVLKLTYVDAGIAPDPNEAVMPPPTSLRGRGLALVVAVATTVERTVVNGVTITIVTFDRAPISND